MIIYILILLILDRITKLLVTNITSIEIIKNLFYITYAKNTGIAFSFLTNNNLLITILTLLIIVFIIYYVIKNKPKNKLLKIGYSLLISGAIGNLIDRTFYGYVIDFIDIYIFNYNYPIFNLADSFIVIGIIILILGGKNDNN